jgi:hypothetical protein
MYLGTDKRGVPRRRVSLAITLKLNRVTRQLVTVLKTNEHHGTSFISVPDRDVDPLRESSDDRASTQSSLPIRQPL